MRVIAGSARALKLQSPDGEAFRPTLDRVKEALFSMLDAYIPGANVLDLFSGSGALGIEALSRGAKHAVFVDSSADSLVITKKNVASARFSENAAIVRSDALEYLKNAAQTFDIIFLDPPYKSGLYAGALDIIAKKSLLSPDGFAVCEWDSRESRPDFPQDYEVFRDKRYGRVCITVLKLPV